MEVSEQRKSQLHWLVALAPAYLFWASRHGRIGGLAPRVWPWLLVACCLGLLYVTFRRAPIVFVIFAWLPILLLFLVVVNIAAG